MGSRFANRSIPGVGPLNHIPDAHACAFKPHTKARFLTRPNRYLILAETPSGTVEAHCPNPGRLREILQPGCEIFLEKSASPNRKTSWTLAAARYRGNIIPLISVRANRIAERLLLSSLYPGYSRKSEISHGSSRFDWLLQKEGHKVWLEVKACTLVEGGRAMFPDAPSLRAVKHLNELAQIVSASAITAKDADTSTDTINTAAASGAVLLLVMNPNARVFSPNPHTDPDFCKCLFHAVNSGVKFQAASVETQDDGSCDLVNSNLDIDMSSVLLAERDEGVLVHVWEIERERWLITIDAYGKDLGKWQRRKPRFPEHHAGSARLRGTLPIRGSRQVFIDELENTTTGVFLKNPLFNRDFMNQILRIRHQVVFESGNQEGFTNTRPV